MNEKDFDQKSFALRLAILREKKGVSARDMSLSIGQNSNYINSIESRGALPSLPGFMYICEYLNITPNEFFDLDSTNPAKLNKIIDDLKRMNDKQLNALAVIIKEMRKK